MDGFTLLMAAVRGVQLAALLSAFGSLVFAAVLAPAGMRRRLGGLARWSAAIAFTAASIWLVLEAAAIAGATTLADTLAALPLVITDTRFGQFVAVRLILLLAVLALAGARRAGQILALLLAGAALALQAAIGHVGAVGGGLGTGLMVSESLHLLAAGAWLGGLLPLQLSLRLLPAPQAADICERFTPLGLACVLVIAATALAQGWDLIGSIPALFGTDYGHVALLKIALFLVALGFAARNRLSLTDRLSGTDPERATRQLRRSIAGETTVGLLIVLAAGVLASLAPGAHEQPVWPFPVRLSPAALAEPGRRYEVILALAAVAVGIGVVVASLIRRRLRVPAAGLAMVLIVGGAIGLRPLLVEAYPTSFQTPPMGFSVAAIVRGEGLFKANCTSCHGADGQGNGPAAAVLPVRPADLTAPHLWAHSDGDLFWWISHGIEAPQGGLVMPGFAGHLSAADRWDLIDFLHANNAGAEVRSSGEWALPVLAPDMPIQCGGNNANQESELRGQALIVVADTGESPRPEVSGAGPQDGFPLTVLHLGHVAAARDCVADTPDAWPAYALLAGVPPDGLARTVFLVDPNGWLRALYPPAEADDANQLVASLRAISEHPLSTAAGAGHEHHH